MFESHISDQELKEMSMSMSKGSKPRPMIISQEEFAKNFDEIFRNTVTEEQPQDQFELIDDIGDLNIKYIKIDENTDKGVVDK